MANGERGDGYGREYLGGGGDALVLAAVDGDPLASPMTDAAPSSTPALNAIPTEAPSVVRLVAGPRVRPRDLATATARAILAEAREDEREAEDARRVTDARIRAAEDDIAWFLGSSASAHGYQAQSYDVGGGAVYFEGDAAANPETWAHVDDGTEHGAWVREVDLHLGGRLAVWDTRAPSVCDHLRRQDERHRAELRRAARVGPRVAALSLDDRRTLALAFAPPALTRWDGKAKVLYAQAPQALPTPTAIHRHDDRDRPLWVWEKGKRVIRQKSKPGGELWPTEAKPPGTKWRLVGPDLVDVSWSLRHTSAPGALVAAADGLVQGLRDACSRDGVEPKWTLVRRAVSDQVLDDENRGVWTWRRPKGTEGGGNGWERKQGAVQPTGPGWERETPVCWTATSVSLLHLALDTRALAIAHARSSNGRIGAPAFDRVDFLAELIDSANRRRLLPAGALMAKIASEAAARLDGAVSRYMGIDPARDARAKGMGIAKTRQAAVIAGEKEIA